MPRNRGKLALARLNERVVHCRRCPRLVDFRESVVSRASFLGETYWRKPVPGFGDIGGRLLVIGIAPAAHGGNRTGRVFTGDASGRFLVKALHAAGFANEPVSESRQDGLVYVDCFVTAAVKCAPPGDKPTTPEFANCSGFLDEEIEMMKNLRVVLALGALSLRAYASHLKARRPEIGGLKFEHARRYEFQGFPPVYACYHPSPRNTNTGVMTQKMMVRLLRTISKEIGLDSRPSKHN